MDRLKGLLVRLKDLFARIFSQLKYLTLHGYRSFQDNRMSVYSGYATLFIVTAVFPFIMLIISIVNLLPGYSTEDVVNIFLQILPDLGAIENLLVSIMTNLKDQSGGLLASAAAVTTLWSASKGVSAIQKGLDELDLNYEDTAVLADVGLKEKAKDFLMVTLKRLLFTLMLIVLFPALLVFDMLGESLVNVISSIIEKLTPEGVTVDLSNVDAFFHLSLLAVILFALLVILEIFAGLPAKRRTLKSQLPGAILTGACWLAFTELFSFFIPRFYHASSLYGSLASLFLLLLWLRFVVMILFGGAILNHTLEEQRLAGAGDDADAML